MSMAQQESKSLERAAVLSRDVSSTADPERSKARSKTVLKSPHKTVGTVGSTREDTSSKNWSRAGLRLGA